MNTRSIEPRNFWGLTKQIGPWTTTSVDQSHLAQGYDSPHNNRQFVTPYQQDGTATIPDQQYTRLSIIEPSTDLHFKGGKLRKAKKGFGLNLIPEGFLQEHPNVPTREITMGPAQDVDTTRPILTAKHFPFKGETPEVNIDENDTSNTNVNPSNSDLIGVDGNGGNSIVQLINQVVSPNSAQIATAQNSWTQPQNVIATSHPATTEQIISPHPNDSIAVDVAPEDTSTKISVDATPQREADMFSKIRALQTQRNIEMRQRIAASAALKSGK